MSGGGGATLRVVRTGALEPALNLAVDDLLLEQGNGTSIRTYRWEPSGLSIGRFQDASLFAGVAGQHRLVRRPTGGGAIYHADELTFAVTFDARAAWGTDQTYVILHDAVLRALSAIGARASRLPPDAPSPSPRAHKNAWCFASPGRHDLVAADGRKILGSAQRRIRRPRGRILVHGSLVLSRPAATPFVAAVADQVDLGEGVRETLEESLITELAAALDPLGVTEEIPLTADEFAAAGARAPRFRAEHGAASR
jgi:lipoate-protein ligase A